MTTSDTKSKNIWLRLVQRMKTNESEWEQKKKVILGFKMKQKANVVSEGFYSIFYAMYNYNILNNIGYL